MKVLVAYATRHGATREIADHIAGTLRRNGLDATLAPIDAVRDVAGYDAFVIGSAAYYFHWLKEATAFVRRHRDVLSEHAVWLFSSGPLGAEADRMTAEETLASAEPKEFAELAELVKARDLEVFSGAYDPAQKPMGFVERLTRIMPAAKDLLRAGDFRDWPAIEAWAEGIARELRPAAAGV